MIPEREREALMRLTMCAREECSVCKYQGDCNFDFQYELATKNMNILAEALRKPSNSEKPNNSTISKMEQVDGECADCKWHDKEWWYIKCDGCSRLHSHFEPKDEPQTELVRVKYHCINCAENGSYKCSKCDGEMYYKYDKDEPQTDCYKCQDFWNCDGQCDEVEDEPQTDVYDYKGNGKWERSE